MPIYEYECEKCGNPVDVLQKIGDAPPAKCEKCGAKLRPGRDRCPRCRAFVAVPDPARQRETSRKLARISAAT